MEDPPPLLVAIEETQRRKLPRTLSCTAGPWAQSRLEPVTGGVDVDHVLADHDDDVLVQIPEALGPRFQFIPLG